MSQDRGFRSLADQLRNWSDERLTRLLSQRPDLATPAPHDFGQLASRAAVRSSVSRALDRLTRGELHVLDALVVLGQTTRDELVSILSADPRFVITSTETLLDLAVVWSSPEGLRPLSAVAECLVGGSACGVSGLHPRSTAAPAPEEVAGQVAALSPASRALLEHVLAEGGRGTAGSARRNVRPDDAASPAEELLARGLLAPSGPDLLVVPGEAALALRGGRTTTDPIDRPPELATVARSEESVAGAAAGAAHEFVRRTEVLLEWWSHRPAGSLRSGGLAVREFRATAAHLQAGDHEAALLIEVAAAAGLAARRADPDGNQVWVPTDAFDAWVDAPLAERWTRLARAWLTSPRLPGLVGLRDADGKAWNALVPELSDHQMPEAKVMALTELAALPQGTGLASGTGVASLVARLQWLRPRRPRGRSEQAAWAVAEATQLGIIGREAMSEHGRAVVAGEDPVPALDALLPAPLSEVMIQADLTAVAPGPLTPEVARSLDLLADVESRGAATVYRFGPASVRRALDAGWSAEEIHDFLAEVSATPVPQPLSYLVDDATRSFGRLRVGHADAFVRSDDEAALAALLHDPKAPQLGLRRIAPTVLISTTPVDVLLPRLRELGLAPVVEAPDGTVRVGVADRLRARTPRQHGAAQAEARQVTQVAAAIRSVRSGEQAAATRPARALTPGGALSALRDAVERRAAVMIAFTDHQGVVGERVVDPIRVEGGELTAHDRTADDVRTFAVHRIRSVRPADERAHR